MRHRKFEYSNRRSIKATGLNYQLRRTFSEHEDDRLKWCMKKYPEKTEEYLSKQHPLLVAIELGDMETVNQLLKDHLDAKYPNGQRVAHGLAAHGHIELFKWVYARDPLQCCERDSFGMQPIHYICQRGHLEFAKYYLSREPRDISAANRLDSLPIHFACASRNIDLVKYILSIAPNDVLLPPPRYNSVEILDVATPVQYASPFYIDSGIPHQSLGRTKTCQAAFLFNVPPIMFDILYLHSPLLPRGKDSQAASLLDYLPFFDPPY